MHLDTAYETLNSQTMELTSFSDRKITGTIDVEKAGNLCIFDCQRRWLDGVCRWKRDRAGDIC
ncbi:MAG: hypothetical protein ACLR78_01020 [Roseburia sp.]